jgi:hypothetical protein
MSIPMCIKQGEEHPSLNTEVYKGADFPAYKQLYEGMQEVCKEPKNNFMIRISDINICLQELELKIIAQT